ncbi:MAG: hypothetical protein GXY61_04415, partial [Lentisphaerae bacterium]|nr:hypothetical protein [Lentisphaerota bacterium]
MNGTVRLEKLIDKSHIKYRDFGTELELEAFGVSNTEGITRTAHRKSDDLGDYLVIEPGDFAYNPYRINVGSIGLTPADVTGVVSPAYIVFRPKAGKLIPEVLLDFLKSSEGLRQINKLARGAVRKALRYDDLCEIEIPAISYERQLEILEHKSGFNKQHASLLGEIAHQEALLGKLKQAILQEAIQGKLTADWRAANPDTEPASELLKRIQKEKLHLIAEKKLRPEKPLPKISPAEIPFEIPAGWEWVRLGDLCRKVTDGFHNTPPKVEKGFPYIAATHVKSDGIDFANAYRVDERYHRELHSKTAPQKGEILIVNIGAGSGCPAIIDVDFEFSFKNTAILKFSQEMLSNLYLLFYLRHIQPENYALLTRGANQPFLSLKVIKEFCIPLPPLAE